MRVRYGKPGKQTWAVKADRSGHRLSAIARDEVQEQMRRYYNQGLSDNGIAEAVGYSSRGVRYWRKRHGFKPNGNGISTGYQFSAPRRA